MDEILVGAELYCVAFVRDYVQFRFHCESEDAQLNAYALPTVMVNGTKYRFGDIGYRDALCGLIDQIVEAVFTREGKSISIMFKSSNELRIKLNNVASKPLVEYAQFNCGDVVQVWN
ncbi:hypothetical protein [Cohnella sp. JJ-181]|uniref:hypothetical protein n=1 Tax=Cohnella rhizoplanae TaxID=2974897 RepID=UPI0023307DEC|nr:hypothetical protein [Cohnella sp. JJ-181]